MSLIQQGDVMVQQGEMVVLGVEGDSNSEFLRLLVRGINFLRAGCSDVQLLVVSEDFSFGENRKERRDEVVGLMRAVVAHLQDNGREVFEISSPEIWGQGTGITITRRIPEQTKDMTFGEVPDGRDFFVVCNDETGNNPEEVRCIKVTGMGVKGRYHDGIRLDQDSRRGTAIYPGPKYPVKLIL